MRGMFTLKIGRRATFAALAFGLALSASASAQHTQTSLAFGCGPATGPIAPTPLRPADTYSADRGYGFLHALTGGGGEVCSSDRPFIFAADLPPGSYDVTVELGHPTLATTTSVKAEARRLMLEAVAIAPGQFVTRTFTVHVRTPLIAGGDSVRLNAREAGSFTWDDRLTLEFNGEVPSVRAIYIEPARAPITLHLAGNSTVTDQTTEPYASWGQMFTRFFQPRAVVVANHAESGETLRAFAAERRLQQALSLMREGDYLFIEFAHNDQKPGPNHLDAFTGYQATLRDYIREARARGVTPVLVTPVHRRSFDAAGQIVNTLGDYPEAVRRTARAEKVPLIDLNAMSEAFYEALGVEGSKKSLVHYPAGTFPGQERALEDNTHHNAYGAYELAKMVVEGMRTIGLPVARYIIEDLPPFDPSRPDPIGSWRLPPSPAATAPARVQDTGAAGAQPTPPATKMSPSLPTIYYIGDSTVRNGSGNGANGEWGWGDLTAGYFDSTRVNVVNRALGGRSSRTYLTQGQWERVRSALEPGDVVIMQFGHNDGGAVNDTSRARGSIRGIGEESEAIYNLLTRQDEVVAPRYSSVSFGDKSQTKAWPLRISCNANS